MQRIFNDIVNTDSHIWISEIENRLNMIGYKKYVQNYKNSDFTYWKTFYHKKRKAYQIGLLFYDHRDFIKDEIGIQFECMLINYDGRIDLSVNYDITLDRFEKISKIYYNTMRKLFNKKHK